MSSAVERIPDYMEAILSARPIPVDVISAKRVTVLLLDTGRSRKMVM